MASKIIELFGYAPDDKSVTAKKARRERKCPFLDRTCVKTLSDGEISGVCTLKPTNGGPVICCPVRLYARNHHILTDISRIAFGPNVPLVPTSDVSPRKKPFVAVFGKGWGKELRLPNRGKSGSYFVDWVLAHVGGDGKLKSFVAVEVQSIDTTGNYRDEREAYLNEMEFSGSSTAGFNWENVNKRILPQLIFKGHVLRQEPRCAKGLFFVCPTPVYTKIRERLGGDLRPYEMQPGSLTIMWYDVGEKKGAGHIRDLSQVGAFTTTVDQVALAFTSPSNLPPARVYELAIQALLDRR